MSMSSLCCPFHVHKWFAHYLIRTVLSQTPCRQSKVTLPPGHTLRS